MLVTINLVAILLPRFIIIKLTLHLFERTLAKKSNYHYVLWYKEERTILIKHEEYRLSLASNPP